VLQNGKMSLKNLFFSQGVLTMLKGHGDSVKLIFSFRFNGIIITTVAVSSVYSYKGGSGTYFYASIIKMLR
jgi:hypothetical protein